MAYSVLPLALDGWGAGDNKKSFLQSSNNPKDYCDPQHSIWATSLLQWMDGEPETIKRVCREAALTPRTFMTPSYRLVHLPLSLHGWGASDNKKSLLRSSINSQVFYDPQHNDLVHLPLAVDGWGAGDNKKSLLRSSISLWDFHDPQHSIWVISL